MQSILQLSIELGLWLAFVAVLVEQIGFPVPAYPALIITAAYCEREGHTPLQVVAVAVLACLIADLCWYAAGARLGRRVLWLLCRISLSPDSCVRKTEDSFERWGLPSLVVAKFIPGFGTVATAMAGVVRAGIFPFLAFDIIGAALYTGVGILIGRIFRDAVEDVLTVLAQAGQIGLVVILIALGLYIGMKLFQRHQLLRQLRMDRVSVHQLQEWLQRDSPPLILDVQSSAGNRNARIPGALWLDAKASDDVLRQLPRAAEVVIYCACPNEASAASAAKRLIKAGFTRVMPLQGGIDAWVAAGFNVESGEAQAVSGSGNLAHAA